MQHYGVPTRLLDFSSSPYVASFFALENNQKASDRAIWALDKLSFAGRVEEFAKVRRSKEVFKEVGAVDLFFGDLWVREEFLERFIKACEDEKETLVVPVGSPWVSERIMVQQSQFVMPTRTDISFMECLEEFKISIEYVDLIKIIVPQACRRDALIDLQRMNINRASLFPGLDGFAQSIVTTLEVENATFDDASAKLDAELRQRLARTPKKHYEK
jgi:hypothetical protein